MKRGIDQVVEAAAGHAQSDRSWLVGEPWFDPPQLVRDDLADTALLERFGYPPIGGLDSCRRAVAEMHQREGLTVEADQILPTHGAKGALLVTLAAIAERGDQIVRPQPAYPAYRSIAEMLGLEVVVAPQPDHRYDWDLERLGEEIGPRARAIILASPANPNGAVLEAEQARELVEFCRSQGMRLICDEAYDAFRFGEGELRRPVDFDPELRTVIVVRSISKTFGLCGWRLGYIVADRELVARAALWQSSILNPPNILAQQGMRRAHEVPDGFFADNRQEMHRRVCDVVDVLDDSDWETRVPDGGFYVWARLAEGQSIPWCCSVAKNLGLMLWPGDDFGAPGWVRLSVAGHRPEHWHGALVALRDAIG